MFSLFYFNLKVKSGNNGKLQITIIHQSCIILAASPYSPQLPFNYSFVNMLYIKKGKKYRKYSFKYTQDESHLISAAAGAKASIYGPLERKPTQPIG